MAVIDDLLRPLVQNLGRRSISVSTERLAEQFGEAAMRQLGRVGETATPEIVANYLRNALKENGHIIVPHPQSISGNQFLQIKGSVEKSNGHVTWGDTNPLNRTAAERLGVPPATAPAAPPAAVPAAEPGFGVATGERGNFKVRGGNLEHPAEARVTDDLAIARAQQARRENPMRADIPATEGPGGRVLTPPGTPAAVPTESVTGNARNSSPAFDTASGVKPSERVSPPQLPTVAAPSLAPQVGSGLPSVVARVTAYTGIAAAAGISGYLGFNARTTPTPDMQTAQNPPAPPQNTAPSQTPAPVQQTIARQNAAEGSAYKGYLAEHVKGHKDTSKTKKLFAMSNDLASKALAAAGLDSSLTESQRFAAAAMGPARFAIAEAVRATNPDMGLGDVAAKLKTEAGRDELKASGLIDKLTAMAKVTGSLHYGPQGVRWDRVALTVGNDKFNNAKLGRNLSAPVTATALLDNASVYLPVATAAAPAPAPAVQTTTTRAPATRPAQANATQNP